MLTSTLEKAYSIYSKLSSAYKWKKIDLCLRRQESGNIYSNRKEFYVVRFHKNGAGRTSQECPWFMKILSIKL